MKKYLFISMLMSLFILGLAFAASESFTLVTKEEGALKEAPHGLYEVGRHLNNGPDIKIVSPQLDDKNKLPVKLAILFVPVEGKEVDLAKLKVEYLKLITIDLTDRVLPYTTKEGIKIEKADLPSGKHTIRITVGDVSGGVTEQIFTMKLE
ncbi:MAG: hypothetical protein HZA14_07380 [Nitrospirae bacterium]|nr:hypothetical protein [Nitrospirota bacterium]